MITKNIHCIIIHHESLCTKSLKSNNCINLVTKIINKMRGSHNSLKHRKFVNFLKTKSYSLSYSDLSLFTEVRWLSRGKCLIRFFALREEILEFIKIHKICEEPHETLNSLNFYIELAFLTDFTQHLNQLNLKLQGRNHNIFELTSHIDCFIKKTWSF